MKTRSLLEGIDFDDPMPAEMDDVEQSAERLVEKPAQRPLKQSAERPKEKSVPQPAEQPVEKPWERPVQPKHLESTGVVFEYRKSPMKPGRFDGTGSLESFLAQFDVCARHNGWTSADRVDFLRCSLEKAATQLLWDFGARQDVTYEELVGRLRQRYGTEGQAETFRAQLHYRRQRTDETLSNLLHEIRRLVVLAYPVPSNETTEIIARDAFLEAMHDRELSLKVREREPKSLDEAYRTALRLEAYQRTTETEDRRRTPNRVRGTQGTEMNGQMQSQLDRFLAAQLESQRKWQKDMEERFNRQFAELRSSANRDPEPRRETYSRGNNQRDQGRTLTCFNCGRAGHFARNCRQDRRFRRQDAAAEPEAPPQEENVARNHTTRQKPSIREGNNAIYIRGSINGGTQLCLVDTGSEVSLVPHSAVVGLELTPCHRVLMAANGTEIRVLGEVAVPIKMWRGFAIPTTFLVSDQIVEPMLGMDWLRQHKCRLGFGTGALFVGRRRIPLVKGNGSTWCRRVIVAEEVLIPPKCQQDISAKTLYENLSATASAWMTEVKEIVPGLHVARVLVDEKDPHTMVRVVNLTDEPIRLGKDQLLGGLHPVQVELRDEVQEKTEETQFLEKLLGDLTEDVPLETRKKLERLLEEYRDVFSTSEGDLGRTSLCAHRIDTGDAAPVRQPLRRQPFAYQVTIDERMDQMIADGVIEPAVSEWAANVVLARKKDGTMRFCIDYRHLNERTKKDSYPLPRVDECLDALSGASWFSTLDLRSGYHQVAMDMKDADKTAFVTRRGIFRWRVMPFGLCNAPATFQRLMDIALSGLNFETCLVYLDDVIIFGNDLDQHIERLRQVLQRLREAHLKLKPSKCQLLRKTVSFLGHVMTPDGVAVDPSKVEDVAAWPVPERLTEVRAFLGLCSYYRRFIRSFSAIAAPLFALTKKGRVFDWTDECQDSFVRLKVALTTAPVLTLPKNEGIYVLDCDASDVGIGAVLSQRVEGEERVIAYGSRLLSTAEVKYCITRKELLAIVYFVKYYRQYLLGRKFELRTDHAALRWLWKTPEPIGQQGRWLERLSEYEFEIIHRLGRRHGNADALSRKPCRQCGLEDQIPVVAATKKATLALPSSESGPIDPIVEAQEADPDLRIVKQWLLEGATVPDLLGVLSESATVKVYWHQRESLYLRDGIMYRKRIDDVEQLLLPKTMREEFLKLAHTGITGGHLGVRRTRWQIRRRAYWTGWSGDVKRFCQRCPQCNQYRRGKPPKQGPLQPLPCGEPWERLSLDITGPHPRSKKGNIYILTMMDNFSKYVEAVPMANQEAASVAKALVENVIVRYGAPLQILTDQGTNFEGHLFQELCKLLGIDKVRTSSYHPSGNGLIERFHRTLNAMLGKIISSHQRDWEEVLPHVLAAYRASIHQVTGYTPNRLLFGRENRVPLDLVYGRPSDPDPSNVNYSSYVEDLAERMETAYREVREHLRQAAERRKHDYDLRVRPAIFDVGDSVWYFTPRRYQGRSPKWQKLYCGPYEVLKRCGPVNYLLRKSPRSPPFVAHVDKLKQCFQSAMGDDNDNQQLEDPPGVSDNYPRPRRVIRKPVRFQ